MADCILEQPRLELHPHFAHHYLKRKSIKHPPGDFDAENKDQTFPLEISHATSYMAFGLSRPSVGLPRGQGHQKAQLVNKGLASPVHVATWKRNGPKGKRSSGSPSQVPYARVSCFTNPPKDPGGWQGRSNPFTPAPFEGPEPLTRERYRCVSRNGSPGPLKLFPFGFPVNTKAGPPF